MNLKYWAIGGGVGLLLLLLLQQLQPVLMPFIVAMFLAYMGDPLVDRLEERGLGRTLGVCLVFLVITVLLLLLLGLVMPLFLDQLDKFVRSLPARVLWLQNTILPWLQQQGWLSSAGFSEAELKDLLQAHWQQASKVVLNTLKQVSSSGMAIALWLTNLFLIPVVTFYLLRDWDILVAKVKALLPIAWQGKTSQVVIECDEVLSAFLRGQLLVMLSLGAIYSLGLSIAGVQMALLLGIGAGLASVVPYMGAIVGIGSASLAAYFQFGDLMSVLPVFLVFGIGQMLESMVLTPLLVGDKIGLHPVAVIFAVMAGGQLGGFIGILIALPVAAVLLVCLRHLHQRYLSSGFYRES